jgi:hypothetical protein
MLFTGCAVSVAVYLPGIQIILDGGGRLETPRMAKTWSQAASASAACG